MKVLLLLLFILLSSFNVFGQYVPELDEPSWVYIGKAKRLIDEGESGWAMSMLQGVIKTEPNNADAHYNLANIYYNAAGGEVDKGSLASYKLATYHYKKALENEQNFTIPSDEIETYFKLLYIYDITLDEQKFAEINNQIESLARNSDRLMRGRIYFKLGSHYNNEGSLNKAIENYKLAYNNGYRRKITLFRISLILRKQRDYVGEKRMLLLSDSYRFDYQEPSNAEVERSIKNRLVQLENIVIPSNFH